MDLFEGLRMLRDRIPATYRRLTSVALLLLVAGVECWTIFGSILPVRWAQLWIEYNAYGNHTVYAKMLVTGYAISFAGLYITPLAYAFLAWWLWPRNTGPGSDMTIRVPNGRRQRTPAKRSRVRHRVSNSSSRSFFAA
jgi:hypothetical protein